MHSLIKVTLLVKENKDDLICDVTTFSYYGLATKYRFAERGLSELVHVMAWCLTAPNGCLKHYKLTFNINEALLRLPGRNFNDDIHGINHCNVVVKFKFK